MRSWPILTLLSLPFFYSHLPSLACLFRHVQSCPFLLLFVMIFVFVLVVILFVAVVVVITVVFAYHIYFI